LIADDHAMVADGLRYIVAAQPDMEVLGIAGNGLEAVRLARELQPDIVVMDYSMPELNGAEAARRILEGCPHSGVVMLSMYSDVEHVRRAVQVGALGYVMKKSASRELVAAIRAVSAAKRFLSAELASMIIDEYAVGDGADDPLARLSGREREVLQLLAEGRKVAEISDSLALSPRTVETYRTRLMEKLGIRDLAGLVRFAIQRGVIHLE
jgi:DNA-binding NarL/FixJ family response regulator